MKLDEVERVSRMLKKEKDPFIKKQLQKTLGELLHAPTSERRLRNFVTYPVLAIFYITVIAVIGMVIAHATGHLKLDTWAVGLLWTGFVTQMGVVISIIYKSLFPAKPPTP